MRRTQLEPDGSFRIALAHEDPGPNLPNWVDPGGRPTGRVSIRFQLPTERPLRPVTEVVPVATLRG